MNLVMTSGYNHNTTLFTPDVKQSIADGESYSSYCSMAFTNNHLFPFFFDNIAKRNMRELRPTKMKTENSSTVCLNGIRISCIGGSIASAALRKNIQKTESFIALCPGWDGENGKQFSKDFVNTIIYLLRQLDKQPEVFPISDGSIQLEYETAQGEYLEFEISQDNRVIAFYIDQNGKEQQHDFLFDIDEIKRQVAEFNERSL